MTYLGETVTLIRESPGGYDAYGDPIASTPTEMDVADVKVAPRTSSTDGTGEPTERGSEGVVIGWALYAPPGTVAYYTDTVRVRGVVCRVEGEIADWPMGVVINCTRA